MEQDGQQHLELELELPAENRQEEQDIITITDDEETEVLHELQAELELEAEPQPEAQPELQAEGERQAELELEAQPELEAEPEHEAEPELEAQDSSRQEEQEIITITDDDETEVLHELQVEPQLQAEDDNDVITISDDEETEALNELQAEPEVRAQAEATYQPRKAGGSGHQQKKRNRNVQREESSLKAKRPKLFFLSSANANKRYSCHICDGTFHLRAQLKNHIENGQHEMDQSVRRKSSSTTTASSANQNESLEDFLKRYETRWFGDNGEFVQERESN